MVLKSINACLPLVIISQSSRRDSGSAKAKEVLDALKNDKEKRISKKRSLAKYDFKISEGDM